MNKPTLVEFPIKIKLSDVPGRLRWLADRYEANTEDDPLPETVVILDLTDAEIIDMRCFGECPSDLEIAGIFHLALEWITTRLKTCTTKR